MNQPVSRQSAWLPDQWDRRITEEHVRSRLMQTVTIHHAMFDKLLFQQQALPLELAQLLEDAAQTYLKFSREIELHHDGSDPMLNTIRKPGIVDAGWIVQSELLTKPGVLLAEHVTQPVEDCADGASVEPVCQCDRIERDRNPQIEL